MKYNDRQSVQEDWVDNKIRVICATNAFGMGIDKPDVRFVVHLDLPESLEAYFQEAGRAGRDGKTAYAAVFFTKADQEKLREGFAYAFPEIDYIKKTYQAICNYYQVAMNSGLGLSVDFDIDKICASYNLLPVLVFNSVKFLEKEGYLSLLDAGYEPSKVHVTAGKEDVYEFQVKYSKYEPLIKTLLRSYGGLLENYVFISEKDVAYRAKMSQSLVAEYLQLLDKQQILSYVPQTTVPKLIFTSERVSIKYLDFNPDNYEKLKQMYLERINSVIDYTNNNKVCRQVQLLLYFNEHNYFNCGYCDVCLAAKPKDLGKAKTKLKSLLKEKPLKLEQIKAGMRIYNDEVWVQALNELVDDGFVKEEEGGYWVIG
jgi:ATP-dependent DNA helicase RecQ